VRSLSESAGPGPLGPGNGRYPYCTRCARKADLLSGPDGYVQDPRGRIGLRFVWEHYIHKLFYCLRPCAGMPKPLDIKDNLNQCHGTLEGTKSSMLSSHRYDFSHPFLRFYSPRSSGAAGGPAIRRPRKLQPAFAMLLYRSPSPKTGLPDIRFFHSKISKAKYTASGGFRA